MSSFTNAGSRFSKKDEGVCGRRLNCNILLLSSSLVLGDQQQTVESSGLTYPFTTLSVVRGLPFDPQEDSVVVWSLSRAAFPFWCYLGCGVCPKVK